MRNNVIKLLALDSFFLGFAVCMVLTMLTKYDEWSTGDRVFFVIELIFIVAFIVSIVSKFKNNDKG